MIIIKKNPEAEKKAGAKYVIKRNGSEDLFDEDKIVNALFKANDSTIKNKITKKTDWRNCGSYQKKSGRNATCTEY